MKKLINRFVKIFDSKATLVAGIIIILVGGFGVRLYGINNPIADWHSWRQVDTASVSKIFVEEGIDLLHPKYHDVSKIQTGYENPNGYRYVEFPIFNLAHATLSQTFPALSFDALGRMVSIISALLTTYFLFGIGTKLFNKWVGLSSAFFYAFLPFNVYFTRVILPDPMAVMFGIGSVFFFTHYINSKKALLLILSAIFFAIAMLVKPHAIFFGLPLAYLYFSKNTLADAMKSKSLFIALDIALVPFLLWRIWMYQPELLRGIAHWEWSFNGNGIRFRPSFWMWIFGERVGKLILGVWGIFPFLYGALSGKKLTIVHAFLLGAFLYVSIFASANVMHDYYQTFITPAISIALGVGVYEIWTNKNFNFFVGKIGLGFAIGMMFLLSFYAIRDNWRINDTGMVGAGREADALLPADALVIAPYNGDTTFLYQTRRSGWPTVTNSIDRMIEMGADYYISVNFSDPDTSNFKNRFEVVKETDKFIIIDLKREKGQDV